MKIENIFEKNFLAKKNILVTGASKGIGREVAMAIRNTGDNSLLTSFRLMMKDFSFAMIGLIISIAIAIGVNDQLTFASMLETIPAEFGSGITKFFSRIGL